jgi:hypothetical protein
LISRVVPGPGLDLADVTSTEDATPLSSRTLIPWCGTSGPAEPGRWYEARVYLGQGPQPSPPEITWAGAAHLTWPDGTEDTISPVT